MKQYHGWKQKRTAFQLPMTTTFLVYQRQDKKTVAHALDFDLVSVGETPNKAVNRLRAAVKLYIEFGLTKGWEEDIRFPAPPEYWARLTADTPVSLMEPIQIEDNRPGRNIVVFGVTPHTLANSEHPQLACEAS